MTTKVTQSPQAMEHLKEQAEQFRLRLQGLEQKQNLTEMEKKLTLPMLRHQTEQRERLLRAAEGAEPFIDSLFPCAPEVNVAMDIPYTSVFGAALIGEGSAEQIDKCEEIGLGTDMCTAIRLAVYAIEADVSPIPTAVIALLHPCDGTMVLHQAILSHERWRNVPFFGADPPYMDDERSIDYYAEELKRMVGFLEEHTERKLDMDRLREVIKENNKQYELWAEYNELKRAVPCPHAGTMGTQMFGIAQGTLCGDPLGTEFMRVTIADAEQRVREKKGWLENERIRLLWFDIGGRMELRTWLEQEWGANIVMDMFGYHPYTPIDTSTEDTIFKGMAKRYLFDVPMIRQARGMADNFANDIRRIVKDYKIDCVIWPGHMGHKDSAASVGLMREMCRDISVPFLNIGMDLFDPRYTTLEKIKEKMSQFFTAMGLG